MIRARIARLVAPSPREVSRRSRGVLHFASAHAPESILVAMPHRYNSLMQKGKYHFWGGKSEFGGDMPSCWKVLLGTDHVKAKIRPVKEALARRFGFRLDVVAVKQADLVCMATELRDLLPPAWMDFGHLPAPHPDRIQPVGPESAYRLFLERYEEVKHLARPAEVPRAARKRRAV